VREGPLGEVSFPFDAVDDLHQLVADVAGGRADPVEEALWFGRLDHPQQHARAVPADVVSRRAGLKGQRVCHRVLALRGGVHRPQDEGVLQVVPRQSTGSTTVGYSKPAATSHPSSWSKPTTVNTPPSPRPASQQPKSPDTPG
jgi:hypothetical protein